MTFPPWTFPALTRNETELFKLDSRLLIFNPWVPYGTPPDDANCSGEQFWCWCVIASSRAQSAGNTLRFFVSIVIELSSHS